MSNMTRRGFLGLLGKALAIGAVTAAAPEILEASAPPVDGLGSGFACPNAAGHPGPQGSPGISCPNAVGNPGVTGCTGSTGPAGVSGTENCLECWNLRHELEKRWEPLTWRGHRILTEHELDHVIFPYGPEPD